MGAIAMGSKTLDAMQQALSVTGQNIANANTEGYSRQVVNLSATDPLAVDSIYRTVSAGMVGTGVEVTSIERVRDTFIDARVSDEKSSLGYWERMEDITHQIELIYNEPSDSSLSALMDKFWSSLEDLSNNPESTAVRSTVLQNAQALTNMVNGMYAQLQALGGSAGTGADNAIDQELATDVESLNGWAKEIAAVNVAIKNAEATGDNPNDLYDRRDLLVGKINELVDVNVTNNDPDEYRVTVGGMVLVQGLHSFELTYDQDALDGKNYVYWEGKEKLQLSGGEMTALFETRDETLPFHLDALNEFAVSFTEAFNEIHQYGFGLDGKTRPQFFAPLATQDEGIYQLTGNPLDMPPTNTYVMQADVALDGGSATTAVVNYENDPIGAGKLQLNGYTVAYNCATDSLNAIVARINDQECGVIASVDPTGRLQLTATAGADYTITSLDDTGTLLSRLGILAAGAHYDGSSDSEADLANGVALTRPPAADAAMRFAVSEDIRNDLDAIAAAGGTDTNLDGIPEVTLGEGNTDVITALAAFKTNTVMENGTASFADYYNGVVAKLGVDAQVAASKVDSQTTLVENLTALQDSVSGVSLDDEMTNLLKFQRGFEAASRFITIIDSCLDKIINGMG